MKPKSDFSVLLTWREEPSKTLGPGISRPREGAKTREFKLTVRPQGQRPMTWITKAESKQHAVRYAKNIWPGADVQTVSRERSSR